MLYILHYAIVYCNILSHTILYCNIYIYVGSGIELPVRGWYSLWPQCIPCTHPPSREPFLARRHARLAGIDISGRPDPRQEPGSTVLAFVASTRHSVTCCALSGTTPALASGRLKP